MATAKDRKHFERLMLRHLDASYNLALWLLHDTTEAEDVVQIAYMKAFEHFTSFTGGNTAGWILTIVRNTAYNWLSKRNRGSNLISFEDVLHSSQNNSPTASGEMNPEELASAEISHSQITGYMKTLSVDFREVLFLREIEGYSYKEIAEITQVSKGTVMSRLSRARGQLRQIITDQTHREKTREL
ncbi:MAG TPA: sigma-70 family RNA polymerase sigma factor [Gammaproteobacteria bacterium]|nr:sigma-70 family RNA polymerase sigma factor [Gammaproteobacteria bacterium]